ncbi:DUF5829 family protein [Crocinitomix catalasitica]|uniref:DUF5829 family protein n=1 Tax=Crocinitomix catalasitica TaxID=184607 RepID=UPI0012F72398|nr:DUF5829 family protein [Crocinitomix catalasitica]
MKRILTLLILLTICLNVKAQTKNCAVVLNHFLLVVDSNTYQAILGSEIVNSDFAYAYERTKNWEGIYIIGQDNYIEIFHPNSLSDEYIPAGFTWVCQASLVANCTDKYDLPDNDLIDYSSDDYFDELTVYTQDAVNAPGSSGLMTTREMNKKQYESWTKKKFNDTVIFQTTDYNSLAESDSAKNYLFNNVTGIEINVNIRDSLSITQYLNLIGYTVESKVQNKLKFSNTIDFIELNFSKNVEFSSIAVIYFKLNQPTALKNLKLGNSTIVLSGNNGKWDFNKN